MPILCELNNLGVIKQWQVRTFYYYLQTGFLKTSTDPALLIFHLSNELIKKKKRKVIATFYLTIVLLFSCFLFASEKMHNSDKNKI